MINMSVRAFRHKNYIYFCTQCGKRWAISVAWSPAMGRKNRYPDLKFNDKTGRHDCTCSKCQKVVDK